MADFTITQDVATVYKLRATERFAQCQWCTVTIREWPRGGSIDVQSDNGSFAYTWTATGDGSFTDFLAGLNYDYFMSKAHSGRGRQFAFEKSVERLKREVLQFRRGGGDKHLAREDFDALCEMDHTWSADHFITEIAHRLPDLASAMDYDFIEYEDDPCCRRFWDGPWQILCARWRVENKSNAA